MFEFAPSLSLITSANVDVNVRNRGRTTSNSYVPTRIRTVNTYSPKTVKIHVVATDTSVLFTHIQICEDYKLRMRCQETSVALHSREKLSG